jgi:hypothetical protein
VMLSMFITLSTHEAPKGLGIRGTRFSGTFLSVPLSVAIG